MFLAITALTGYFVAQNSPRRSTDRAWPPAPKLPVTPLPNAPVDDAPHVVHAVGRPAGITITGLLVGYGPKPSSATEGELFGDIGDPAGQCDGTVLAVGLTVARWCR